jgi:4-hydroxy-tetrahydrodipicolinate synthase
MNQQFTGTGIALVTPFDKVGNVDYEALLRLLQHTQDHVEYWVVHGTTGEAATTTAQERKAIAAFIKNNNPKNKTLVYGLGGNNTQELLDELKSIDFSGFSALLSVSPYYNKPSQEGIYQHYLALAEASPLPLILYNVPGRTMSNMTAQTTLRLAAHRNIVGIKEASGNVEQCMRIAKDKPADFLLISGDDLLTVPLIAVGATGVISVLANAFPQSFGSMVRQALAGNFAEANKHLYKFLEINDLMYAESNPVGVKQTLALLGITGEYVRQPLLKASAELKEKIASMIEKI